MSEKTPRLDGPSGYAGIIPFGTNAAGNYDRIRTDTNRVIWVRPYDGYLPVDPVLMAAADGILWNPGATAAQRYSVEFLAVNIDTVAAAAIAFNIGVDRDGGGALTDVEYWVREEVITYPGSSGWRGPFIINGNDDVRLLAAIANDVAVQWLISRLDTGV